MFLFFVVILTLVMGGGEYIESVFPLCIQALCVLLVLSVSLGLPIASVAETFEHDVLRSLNNPVVVRNAQKHFGQQMLGHLHTLEWGFRVGGSVVNMRCAM